jgi:hypothetical protein
MGRCFSCLCWESCDCPSFIISCESLVVRVCYLYFLVCVFVICFFWVLCSSGGEVQPVLWLHPRRGQVYQEHALLDGQFILFLTSRTYLSY